MLRIDPDKLRAIDTAPRDGTKVLAVHFSTPGLSDWACKAAFKPPKSGEKPTWMEVDGVRGQVFLAPTHWQPLN